MAIAPTIQTWLDEHGIKHWLVQHEQTTTLEQTARVAGIPPGRIARGLLLKDDRGLVLAVVPLTHLVDFLALEGCLERRLEPAGADDARHVFRDCAQGCVPPAAAAYVLDVVVDETLRDFETVYFEAGSHTELVRVSGEDFLRMQGTGIHYSTVACPEDRLVTSELPDPAAGIQLPDDFGIDMSSLTPAPEIRRRIEKVYELPAIPQMAHRLLEMQGDPDATIQDLADVVELDPSLAAQVVRYACSPFFGYRGKIESIHDAITRVLGFDMVMHMALGIAAGKSFRNPPDGPLGLNAFWQHATYSATLAQSLVRQLSVDEPPGQGKAYLAGLLHNFGFLLLGHLFQPEFFLLNKLIGINPSIPVTVLEKQVLGMGHAKEAMNLGHGEMGAWLMEYWNMPPEIVVALRYHHDHDYRGDHWVYARLMLVVDHLLRQYHIGDADSDELPAQAFEELGLDPGRAMEAADHLLEDHKRLDELVRQLVA